MRSELIYGALRPVQNRYALCQLASQATRKFHRPNTRIQDTMNEVLNRFSDLGARERVMAVENGRRSMVAETRRQAA